MIDNKFEMNEKVAATNFERHSECKAFHHLNHIKIKVTFYDRKVQRVLITVNFEDKID